MTADDLIFDVGLHRGEDSEFYLKKGFRVVAFEADPELSEFCRDKFAAEIAEGRMTIVEGAIIETAPGEDRPASITFYTNKDNSVWGTVAGDRAALNESLGAPAETIEVTTVDFGECLTTYGVPHFMKIDIEGMDAVCLRALRQHTDRPDFLSIESDKVAFSNLTGELDLLTELGYDHFQAVQQRGVERRKEPNPSREGRFVGHTFEPGSSGLFGTDLPGRWKTRPQVTRHYRWIFLLYWLFGDTGKISGFAAGKKFRNALIKLSKRPIPGWYDTHARHRSVSG